MEIIWKLEGEYFIPVCVALALTLAVSPAHAAPPTLGSLFPSGAPAGTTTTVAIGGKADPWPPAAWSSNSAVKVTFDKEKKKEITLALPVDLPPGPILLRLHNKEGASAPSIFLVGSLPEHTEDSKHSHTLQDPEVIDKLPVTINGRLNQSDDVDIYRIPLKAGDTLLASVDGYSLRSGIDPYLHLYDPDGVQIALGNDNGRNLDPLLVTRVEKTGDHLVAIMAYETPPGSDVKFTGSSKNVYRLTLTTDPKALPKFPPDSVIPNPLAPPFALDATIAKPNETDRYTFAAKKGQSLLVEVSAQDFGSPLDPVLVLTDAKEKILRTVDDSGKTNRDADYVLKIPADGDYTAKVTDRFRKGSPNHHYQIRVTEPKPSFSATVNKSEYLLEPKQGAAIKIKLTRLYGHDTPLLIDIPNLPKGVTFDQPEITGKSKEFTVMLKAPAAEPASLPITVQLKESEGDKPASSSAVFSFQDEDARGPYLIDELDSIWLTVKNPK